MDNYKRFNGKTAMITGAAKGIGKSVAFRLGQEGAAVLLLDNDRNALRQTEDEFRAAGIKSQSFLIDVSNENHWNDVFNKVGKTPSIDILINAAGIVGPTSTNVTELDTHEFDKVSAVNLKGSFLAVKHTLRHMQKRGSGRILLFASIAGKEGNPGMAAYSASKAGVIGLVKATAKEFATTQITINGLAPAVIKTEMNDDTSAEQLAYMTAKIPMQRLGTTEEVAAVSCFIVSEENSFSTGFIYDISGGRATY